VYQRGPKREKQGPQPLSPRGNTSKIKRPADPLDIDRPVFHSFFHSCGKHGWRTSALAVAAM
jgi:hypothetical protein